MRVELGSTEVRKEKFADADLTKATLENKQEYWCNQKTKISDKGNSFENNYSVIKK